LFLKFDARTRPSSKEGYDVSFLGTNRHNPLVGKFFASDLKLSFRGFVDGNFNAEVYCAQLQRVADILEDREEPVVFLHDNARPHTAKITKAKLQELDWDVLPHAPYSPDKAPSDYWLFRQFKIFLRGKKFNTTGELRSSVTEFFNSKPVGFYERGINKLEERWEEIIEFEGDYCD
jgi:hypothetical protein